MDPRNTPSPAEKLLDEILLASEQATPLKSARKCMLEVLEKALAEKPVKQEPVAFCDVRPLQPDEWMPKVDVIWTVEPVPGPLYTTPQAQPLTDELIPKPEWADTESDWVVKFKRVEGGAA